VSFLDPVRALITFGCTFLSRKYGVLVAALASSLVCETILAAAQGWRYWGQGILPGTSHRRCMQHCLSALSDWCVGACGAIRTETAGAPLWGVATSASR
jgi:hypothetical protein